MTAIVILSQILFHKNGKNDIGRPQLEKVRLSTIVATIISLCPFKLSQYHHISLQNLTNIPALSNCQCGSFNFDNDENLNIKN